MRIAIGLFVTYVLSEGVVHAFAPARPVSRRAPHATRSGSHLCAASGNEAPQIKPDILEPFPPAADPMYSVKGKVGEGDFVLTRTGGPVAEELTNENLLRILMVECSDLEVCMDDSGYRLQYTA